MTKQRILIELLIQKRSVTVREIIESCYQSEKEKLQKDDVEGITKMLSSIRTLISDIRNKKLATNGIEKDILSSLGPDITIDSKVLLNVNAIKDLDRKNIEKNNLAPIYNEKLEHLHDKQVFNDYIQNKSNDDFDDTDNSSEN